MEQCDWSNRMEQCDWSNRMEQCDWSNHMEQCDWSNRMEQCDWSNRMEQCDSRRTNIREISHFRFGLEFVDTSKFRINSGLKITGTLH